MTKKILIIGINSIPELTGIGRYTGEMLNWMVEQGCEVTMITAFPYYPQWKIQQPYTGRFYKKETFSEGMLTIYRCPLYVPLIPSGLKRLIHEITFFLSAFFVVFRLVFKKKHDVVFSVAPPFHLGFLALFYRFFRRVPIIYHIQDLQIDAAKELKILRPDWMFNVLFKMEKFILNAVNVVSTISDGMRKKLLARTKNNVMLFPNWVDIDNYFPIDQRDQLKPAWGFMPEDKLVLYSGSIGEKQGLDSLIRTAEALAGNTSIKFIICGTGPFKEKLIQMAKDLKLQNIYFLPLQSNEVFNDFLNIADVHLVLQKGDASDLVMPSKLTTILSVGGLALVTANPGTTLFDIISEHQMGVVIPPENEILLKSTILRCCEDDYLKERVNARKYAETFLSKEIILKQLLDSF